MTAAILIFGSLPFAAANGVAQASVPSLPYGDLTGDGTVDTVAFIPDDGNGSGTESCQVVITPADTSGPWAGRSITFGDLPNGLDACPDLVAEGQVRADGSWQLFVDDEEGARLETFVRDGDTFVVDHPQASTSEPSSIQFDDTDGDGRDDRVIEGGSNFYDLVYYSAILPDGHFGTSDYYRPFSADVGLTLSHPSAEYGQPNDLQVVLSTDESEHGGDDPTGNVTLKIDGHPAATAPLTDLDSASSSAVFHLPTLTAGRHHLEVDYPGDDLVDPTSGSVDLNVIRASTTAKVTVSPTTGSVVKISVVVATKAPGSGTPTGFVGVLIDGRSVSGGTLHNGVLTLTHRFSRGGAHAVVVGYAGDHNHSPSGTVKTVG